MDNNARDEPSTNHSPDDLVDALRELRRLERARLDRGASRETALSIERELEEMRRKTWGLAVAESRSDGPARVAGSATSAPASAESRAGATGAGTTGAGATGAGGTGKGGSGAVQSTRSKRPARFRIERA
jgi:hypothetical protein